MMISQINKPSIVAGLAILMAVAGLSACTSSVSDSTVPSNEVTSTPELPSASGQATAPGPSTPMVEREPTRVAKSFAEGISSAELLGWLDAAVAEMVDPPTDFMGMLWPIGTARDDEPDPSTFDGDPFREHTAVLSPDEIEEAAAYFADWQSGLAGCDEQEMREFDNGAQRVERWIRGGADVATAPDPCLKSRSAVMAWNAGQDVETARHIFFHEAYHGLSNYLLRQCAPILNRDEDSMNDLRWFAEGTADYFSMYMQAQEDERDDLEQRILQRATLDLQGDPGLTLGSNTYVQTAAMVLMIKRGIVSEEKIIDGSYFNNCDWIDTFDPSEPQIAYIFENFRNIEASNGTFAYSNETIAG